MKSKHFIVIQANAEKSKSDEDRFFRELVDCFDDRHWQVTVWGQQWICAGFAKFLVVANICFVWKLFWTRKSTIVVDGRMLPFLALAFLINGRLKKHCMLLVLRNGFFSLGSSGINRVAQSMYRSWGIRNSKLVLVDSLLTQIQLMEQGVDVEKLRVLSSARKFANKCMEDQTILASVGESYPERVAVWTKRSSASF